MTSLKKFSLRHPAWLILASLVSTLGFSGCAEMYALMSEWNTVESEQNLTEEAMTQPAATPPPSIQDVEEAISSTKTLLDDQQKQIGNLLSLRGEVKQTLREFRDQNLAPMNAAIETLQHQVGGWEETSTTNQATLSSTIGKLAQDLEQAQTRVGVYGEQVTALVDQIDQNNRQYDKLLAEFQNSLVGFKGAMGEFKLELKTEKDRATQEEGILANQLKEQQQTLDQVSSKAEEILVLQKRLNQLHVYINQVRDTVTSDTTALQAALKPEAKDDLRDLLASLEARYQQLAQSPSSNPALSEHLQALEKRVEQSEKHLAETVKNLQDDIHEISLEMQAGLKTPETENLQTLVLGLKERYQQLAQTPSANLALTEHLQALEQRVEKSEKHYAETVKALHDDIQEISVGMKATLKNEATDNLRDLVTSLEDRYQQLAQAPSSNLALTEHLQALEQRVKKSEKHHAETVKALQDEVQTVSARMMTLTQSFGPETMEALHNDIQEISAGMLKLAQSITHLEKTKSPTIPIHAESATAPQGQR